jgi:parallel beta-helix repeat protein
VLKIQPAIAAGIVYIRPDGNVDPPGTPIQKNGDTYMFTDDISASIIVQKSSITIDGAGHLMQGSIFDNGIDLSSITEVTIRNVTINNFDYGVYIASSSHITIYGNTIVNNNGGIWLKESTNNLVSNNVIRDNFLDGIYIWSSSNNTISRNNVEGNVYGITDYYGSSNRIYHNNIINNDYSANPNEPADIWDNGCEGNYWSDYNGIDSNGDGVGDTPYTIDSYNVDHYPLMNRFWNPADLRDVFPTGRAYGSRPGDARWNPHCDINADNIVDLKDYFTVCKNYGQSW